MVRCSLKQGKPELWIIRWAFIMPFFIPFSNSLHFRKHPWPLSLVFVPNSFPWADPQSAAARSLDSANGKPPSLDLPRPATPKGPSGSHFYFGLCELCRTRADPADLWMCGRDRSQCPAGAVRVRGVCDATWWHLWQGEGKRLLAGASRGAIRLQLELPVWQTWKTWSRPSSMPWKPCFHAGQRGSFLEREAAAQQTQSQEANSTALPWAFAFYPGLRFLIWLSLSELMCLPSAKMSGEKDCQPPGLSSVSAHLLTPSSLSVHTHALAEARSSVVWCKDLGLWPRSHQIGIFAWLLLVGWPFMS